jgi:Uma2 family endonuclease
MSGRSTLQGDGEIVVMNVIPRRALYDFDEFCIVVPDGQKADLIDGVIYMASPDNTDAGELNVWLSWLMSGFAEERDLGKVYTSRIAFRLGKRQSPEPDIAFLRKDQLHRVQRNHIEGPPDLAVEIVSPDSIERDYKKKFAQYRKGKVAEYWIVDELQKKLTVYVLTAQGRYRRLRPRKGVIYSQALPGFRLKPQWLWQKPLPRKTAVLAEILGE